MYKEVRAVKVRSLTKKKTFHFKLEEHKIKLPTRI